MPKTLRYQRPLSSLSRWVFFGICVLLLISIPNYSGFAQLAVPDNESAVNPKIRRPADLAGQWIGDKQQAYQITVEGTQVTMVDLTAKSRRQPRYTGSFLAKGFDLVCVARHIDDIAPDLSEALRQNLVNAGYKFRARLEFNAQGNPVLTLIQDTVTRSKLNPDVVESINMDENYIVVPLRRKNGYRIQDVVQRDVGFQQRARSEMETWRRQADYLNSQLLPKLEKEVESLNREVDLALEDLKAQDRWMALSNARVQALQAKIKQLQAESDQERESIFKAYPDWYNRRAQLKGTMRNLRQQKVVAQNQNQESRAAQLESEIEAKALQLSLLNQQVDDLLKAYPAETERLTRINQLWSELAVEGEHQKQLWEKAAQKASFAEIYLDRRIIALGELERKEENLAQVIHQMELLQLPPRVLDVRVAVAGKERFVASLGQDEDIVLELQAERDALRAQKEKTPELISSLIDMEAQTLKQKQETMARLKSASDDLLQTERDLYKTLDSNAWNRFYAEAGVALSELGYNFTEGGIAGMLADITTKIIERAVTGKDAFQLYDESAMREAYHSFLEAQLKDESENTTAKLPTISLPEPHSLSVGTLWDQRAKVLMEAAEVPMQALIDKLTPSFRISRLERVEKLATAAVEQNSQLWTSYWAADKNARALMKDLPGSASARVSVFNRMEELLRSPKASQLERENVRKAYLLANKVYRKLEGQLANSLSASRVALEKIQKTTVLIEKLSRQHDVLKNSVYKNMTGNLKGTVKGIGVGILADTIRSAAHANFEAEEAAAWTRFFEKEILYKYAYETYKMTAKQYVQAKTELENTQAHADLLDLMIYDVENEIDRFSQAALTARGFRVSKNEDFYANEGPIEAAIQVSGGYGARRVFLKGIESAQQLKGEQRYSNKLPETGTPHQSLYGYTFDSSQLMTVQENGPLLFEVEHQ